MGHIRVNLSIKVNNDSANGNTGAASDPIDTSGLFSDIKFNASTLEIDLGTNWNKYYFGSVGEMDYAKALAQKVIYKPAQRYLTYKGAETDNITNCRYKRDDDVSNTLTADVKEESIKDLINDAGSNKKSAIKTFIEENERGFVCE